MLFTLLIGVVAFAITRQQGVLNAAKLSPYLAIPVECVEVAGAVCALHGFGGCGI
jgi:hypothetical protein